MEKQRITRKSLRETASFWRILIAEQIRQFFAIPFKIFLLALVVLFQASSWITHTPWLSTVAMAVFWFLVINITINISRVILIRSYLRRKELPSGHKDNFTTGLKRVSILVSNILFFFVLLYVLGIEITQFFTTISLVAVAIVLIFRDYITSFITGVVILFSDDISIGDRIEVGAYKGKIVDITLLHVELQTDAGDIVFIPNTIAGTKEVTNFSKRGTKTVSVEFTLPRAALKKADALEKRLLQAFEKEFPNVSVRMTTEKIEKDAVVFALKATSSARMTEQDIKQTTLKTAQAFVAKAK